MDVEGLFNLLIDAKNNFLNNPWAQDSTFLFVGVILEIFIRYPAILLIKYNVLTNGAHKDALFYSGVFSVIPAVIALCLGLPFHHISKVRSFISFSVSSACGSSAVLLMLMKREFNEDTGYYYRTVGFFLAMYNFVCALYYRVSIQVYPFATGLMCYNVGTTIIVYHETKRKLQ